MAIYSNTGALPNKYDEGLLTKEIQTKFFKECLIGTNLSPFMGADESCVFVVKHKSAGKGDATTFPLVKNIDYKNPILGNAQVSGNEQYIEVHQDNIRLEEINLAVKTDRIDMTRIKTELDIYNLMKPQLLHAGRMELSYAILRSICGTKTRNFQTTGLYNKTANNGSAPSQYRCVYGADGNDAAIGQYNASIFAGCNAMNAGNFNTDSYTKGGLSVEHLLKLKEKALSNTHEMTITPFHSSKKNSQPVNRYIYLMDPISYGSLRKDPEWEKYIYRGVVASPDQPEGLSGGMYRGMIDGISIYECPELEDFRINNKCAHNLLLGGQAVGILWGKQPTIKTKLSDDYGRDASANLQQIRGQKPLMYPSLSDKRGKEVERGIIHSFVRYA